MVFMDRVRRVGGLAWMAIGLAFQLVQLLSRDVVPGTLTLIFTSAMTALAVVTLLHSRWGTWVVGWIAAVLLGLDFGGSVADRFGLFGSPGTAGVSWGSWGSFVDYTTQLLPIDRPALVEGAAVAATITEIVLCGLLISGWQRRWVGKASAALLFVYLVAMLRSLGAESVATYGLPILIGGALLISCAPTGRPVPRRRALEARAMTSSEVAR